MRRERLLPSIVVLMTTVAAMAAAPAAHGTQSTERWTSQLNQLVEYFYFSPDLFEALGALENY